MYNGCVTQQVRYGLFVQINKYFLYHSTAEIPFDILNNRHYQCAPLLTHHSIPLHLAPFLFHRDTYICVCTYHATIEWSPHGSLALDLDLNLESGSDRIASHRMGSVWGSGPSARLSSIWQTSTDCCVSSRFVSFRQQQSGSKTMDATHRVGWGL